MGIYDIRSMGERIAGNSYVGRGIVIGKSEDGTKAVFAYFAARRCTGKCLCPRNAASVASGTGSADRSDRKNPCLAQCKAGVP